MEPLANPNEQIADTRSSRRRSLVVAVACVVVFLVSSWPTITHPLLVSNDGPQHLLQGFVHAHYDDPTLRFGEVFALNEPLTSRGYLDLFRALEPLLGWYSAHRLIVLFAQALWCSGWAALALRLHRDRWPFALLGCATGIQWAYWVGFLPFFLGLGATLWACHIVVIRPATKHYVLLAAALAICSQIHPLPVVIAGAALLAASIGRSPRDAVLTVLAGLPAFAYCQYISTLSQNQSFDLHWDNDIDPTRAFVAQFFCGDFIVGVVVLVLLLVALVPGWRAAPRWSTILRLTGVALLVASYVAPTQVRGWEMFNPRLLPFGYALIFAFAPLERFQARTRGIVAAVVLTVVVGHLQWSARFHRSLAEDSTPVLDLARRLPTQAGHDWGMLVVAGDVGGLEGLDYESVGPADLNAWLHLAQILALDLGGRPLFTQSSDPVIHGVLAPDVRHFKTALPGGNWSVAWPTIDEGRRRENIAGILSGISLSTGRVVFVGYVGEERFLEESGYEVTARVTDGVLTAAAARFRGCDVTVVVPPDTGLVDSGAMPWLDADSTRVPDVEGFVQFTDASCGPRWIRVDGTPCGGSEFDPAHRARAYFSEGATLVCGPSL
jgi:hypothetical protein